MTPNPIEVSEIARKIYANVHHLMRVTGTEAQDAYERAARSILAMSKASPSGWRTIESAPKDGTFILIYSAWDESIRTGVWREAWGLPFSIPFKDRSLDTKEGYWVEDRYDEMEPVRYPYRPIHDATHWQPLPPPPSTDALVTDGELPSSP